MPPDRQSDWGSQCNRIANLVVVFDVDRFWYRAKAADERIERDSALCALDRDGIRHTDADRVDIALDKYSAHTPAARMDVSPRLSHTAFFGT